MDRNELKRILKEQAEPMDAAVMKKLTYLQSDEVFTDVFVDEENDDDSLFNAFVGTVKPTVPVYQQPTVSEVGVREKGVAPGDLVAEKATAQSIVEHKQNIAAKIAALRGISLPGDYLHK